MTNGDVIAPSLPAAEDVPSPTFLWKKESFFILDTVPFVCLFFMHYNCHNLSLLNPTTSQDVTVAIAKRRNFSSKMGSYVMQTFPIVWNIYTKTSRGSTLSRPLSEGYGYKQWMVKHSNIFFPHRTTVGNNSAENTKIASKEFMTENFPTIAKIIRPATNPTEHNNVRKRN